MLRYMSFYWFREDATRAAMLDLANLINRNHRMLTAYVTGDERLAFDYFLSFKHGIGTFQIINTYRLFMRFTHASVGTQDTEDIVE